MKSTALQLRIAPKKINLIARLVRNKDASQALDILRFTPKKGSRMLYKVVKSAVANAENNFKQERDSLYIKEIVVGKATTLKRSVPISKGRVHPVLKRNSHVTVTIGVKTGAEEKKAQGKAATKGVRKAKSAAPQAETKKTVKTAPAKKAQKITKVKA